MALCSRPVPLAQNWCFPTAIARGWAGHLPADFISIREYQHVKREVYHGSIMISASLLSVFWQLTCPSPQARWQPSSWGNCLPAVRAAAKSPFPTSVFPQGDHSVGNQATHEVRKSLNLAKTISVPAFLSRSISSHLYLLPEIWELQLLIFYLILRRWGILFIPKSSTFFTDFCSQLRWSSVALY